MSDAAAVSTRPVAGSYLTFHLTHAKYALPVAGIQYITTLDSIEPHEVPKGDTTQVRVFTFQGNQISLYNFSRLIGSASQREECEKLIGLLKQRRQDHIDWMEALEHSLRTGDEFSKATDPHRCAFGQWYDAYRATDEELRKIMAQFDTPHKRIHALAETLLTQAADHATRELALKRLEEERHSTLKHLLNLFALATSRLEDLLRPVVVILRSGQHTYAIELDSIDQIMEFTDKHWLPGRERDLQHPSYDGFLQKSEGELFIRLDPTSLVKQKGQAAL